MEGGGQDGPPTCLAGDGHGRSATYLARGGGGAGHLPYWPGVDHLPTYLTRGCMGPP